MHENLQFSDSVRKSLGFGRDSVIMTQRRVFDESYVYFNQEHHGCANACGFKGLAS